MEKMEISTLIFELESCGCRNVRVQYVPMNVWKEGNFLDSPIQADTLQVPWGWTRAQYLKRMEETNPIVSWVEQIGVKGIACYHDLYGRIEIPFPKAKDYMEEITKRIGELERETKKENICFYK